MAYIVYSCFIYISHKYAYMHYVYTLTMYALPACAMATLYCVKLKKSSGRKLLARIAY